MTRIVEYEVLERFSRMVVLDGVGLGGLGKIRNLKVAILGCGALGTGIAELLVRSGVGFIRVVDRDVVEHSNLHRVHLFSEKDVTKHIPKAIACGNRLREISSFSKIEVIVENIDSITIIDLIKDVDIIMDATDNFATRFLLNEAAVKLGKPWVYAAVEAWYGMVMRIVPSKTACLKCFIKRYSDQRGRCDVIGVMGPVASIIASIASLEAIKHALGMGEEGVLYFFDGRVGELFKYKVRKDPECKVCGMREFEHLGSKVSDPCSGFVFRDVSFTPGGVIRIGGKYVVGLGSGGVVVQGVRSREEAERVLKDTGLR